MKLAGTMQTMYKANDVKSRRVDGIRSVEF